jgi:hypothetical protein
MSLIECKSGLSSRIIFRIQLTCSALLHLLHCNGENRKHLDHDFHEYLHHIIGWRDPSVNPKTLEEEVNAFKEVDKHIVARLDILRCLQDVGIKA